MGTATKPYRVGLLLSSNATLPTYELTLHGRRYRATVYGTDLDTSKYCDLVVTDRAPSALAAEPIQVRETHGPVVILNTHYSAQLEENYETVFSKAHALKYRTCKVISTHSLTHLVNGELVKQLAVDGQVSNIALLLNRYTWKELVCNVLRESYLILVPFIAIALYLIVKYVGQKHGYPISFLCWFVEYEPDCKEDVLEELGLLALLYSVFNFGFYYMYILRIFDNVNNDVLRASKVQSALNRGLQMVSTLSLFASAVIILKALFVFKYGFGIAGENGFINIQDILDKRLWFWKSEYLIYYFLLLDVSLWWMVKNVLRAASQSSQGIISSRQRLIITDARKGFAVSAAADALIILATIVVLDFLMKGAQDRLAAQLVLLQAFYLYINLSTVVSAFKYE